MRVGAIGARQARLKKECKGMAGAAGILTFNLWVCLPRGTGVLVGGDVVHKVAR